MRNQKPAALTTRPDLRLKLACAHFHDACRHLARLLAHPHLADADWRSWVDAGTRYWWRARHHLHQVFAGQSPRPRNAAVRCRQWRKVGYGAAADGCSGRPQSG